ncbi:hypothetical protein SAY87_007735 [Trapa incisa]|uniref:Uncharacterized protein n=1 Tax=Trapa incisa TaxID=236973 RepID=A0AAN7KC18_9MYRT|nr:hypothetical protein SAY87_007735 [Trapa incisa]
MSEQALKYHNMLLGSERKIESPENGTLVEKSIDNATPKLEECQRKSSAVVVPNPAIGNELTNGVGEVGTSEIEYIESEKLSDVEDADAALKAVLAGLESKDWLLVCDTLNNIRRLALFRKEVMLNMVEDVITLLVKALKNPRSAVCKTGIMTSADIFFACNDELINFLDPLVISLDPSIYRGRRRVRTATTLALMDDSQWNGQRQGIPEFDESYLSKYIGYGFGLLLLLNHFVGSDLSSITPAQLVQGRGNLLWRARHKAEEISGGAVKCTEIGKNTNGESKRASVSSPKIEDDLDPDVRKYPMTTRDWLSFLTDRPTQQPSYMLSFRLLEKF